MKMFKISIGLILIITSSFAACSQHMARPELGRKFPDFHFDDVRDFEKARVSLSDFQGKWLIIDFWSLGCKVCLERFPEIKEIQEEFPVDVRFLLVGSKGQKADIGVERIYKVVSNNIGLKVANTFDSLLVRKWDISFFPYQYIIDPEGVLRYLTDGRDLSKEKIRSMIEGQKVSFFPTADIYSSPRFDISRLTNTDNIISGSLITRSNGEWQNAGVDFKRFVNLPTKFVERGWSVANVTLQDLYNFAYFGNWGWSVYDTAYYGKVCSYPILELNDSTDFEFDYNTYPATGTYNCYLKVPKNEISVSTMMARLQAALKETFGYNASIELREMPVWQLESEPRTEKKIRTKGGKTYISGGSTAGGFKIVNKPMSQFLQVLTANLPYNGGMPYVDCTGILHPIDISLEGDMTDLQEIQRNLSKFGLSLKIRNKPMKVLVIRDPANKQS